MQQPPHTQSALTLIDYSGFAGDYSENRTLSRERADAVCDRLRAGGIQNVSSVGVGPVAAVACNLDPNTAPQNQRVEVWVHKPRAGQVRRPPPEIGKCLVHWRQIYSKIVILLTKMPKLHNRGFHRPPN